MDSLIYSLNATVPVFLVIILGYVLKCVKMFDKSFLKTADKFNFKITLPAMLFMDLAVTDFAAVFDLKYVLYCFFVTLLCILGIWGLAKIFMKDTCIRGEFVQASYRSSAAVLGMALVVNICGDSGMIPLMILGAVPLYNRRRHDKEGVLGYFEKSDYYQYCTGIFIFCFKTFHAGSFADSHK